LNHDEDLLEAKGGVGVHREDVTHGNPHLTFRVFPIASQLRAPASRSLATKNSAADVFILFPSPIDRSHPLSTHGPYNV
jgi:hypothetical protein